MKRKQHIGAEPPPWDGFQECRFFKDVSLYLVPLPGLQITTNNESLNPMARDGLPPYKWLVRDAPEASKTMLAVADALSCPPELDSKSLLQKAPYTLSTAHRKKTQAGMKLDASSLLARFHRARRFSVGCWRRTVLLSCRPCIQHHQCQARHNLWCSRGVSVRVITNYFLIELETSSTGAHLLLVL